MNLLTPLLNRVITSPVGQVVVGSLLAPNKFLCFRLLWMAKNDQHERQMFFNGKPWNKLIDHHNTMVLKKIVSQYGWPGEKLVGQMGAQAAWPLVQHADHDREFQKKCHSLLEAAVKNNDAQAQQLAYLTDRICVGDDVPQIYGTQIEYIIADQENVDERRAAVGLPPLEDYLTSSQQFMKQVKKRRAG